MEMKSDAQVKLRAIEFYSGIGGWGEGLRQSGSRKDNRQKTKTVQVVAAFDMNTNANAVFRLNHPSGLEPSPRSIEHLKTRDLDRFGAELWCLSPPCQPFTRRGKRLGHEDPRTRSFLHLLGLLPLLQHPPRYWILENVLGFEDSPVCHRMLAELTKLGFVATEFLLTPAAVGIPNDRLRYFILARRGPGIGPEAQLRREGRFVRLLRPILPKVQPLVHFLLPELGSAELEALTLPDDVLKRNAGYRFDVLSPVGTATGSSCFTSSYGSGNVKGSGPVVLLRPVDENTPGREMRCIDAARETVRYLAPREQLNLLGFRAEFRFPESLSLRQRQRLVGNSISIDLAAELLKLLLADCDKCGSSSSASSISQCHDG